MNTSSLDTARIHAFLTQAEHVLAQLSQTLPPLPHPPDWTAWAFRWRVEFGRGRLESITLPHTISLDTLTCVETQKQRLMRNTEAFVAGRSANNVLLTGARGTGKSSLVKALLPKFAPLGLRLIEVDKHDLKDISDIVSCIAHRNERFIIYCDDLSFEHNDANFKALKTALDGGLSQRSDNVLIYATSNRRHLIPETMRDNLELQRDEDGEIRPGESSEEKISLSERFGLWLSFYGFDQDEFLQAVAVWLGEKGLELDDLTRRAALLWAQKRGARSGRVAWQFVQDWAGRLPQERRLENI